MSIKTNRHIEKDGVIYDKLAANLALSSILRTDGMGVSIAVRLTPYRVGNEGPEALHDAVEAVVYGNALDAALNDPDVADFLTTLEAAAQKFIDAKGL